MKPMFKAPRPSPGDTPHGFMERLADTFEAWANLPATQADMPVLTHIPPEVEALIPEARALERKMRRLGVTALAGLQLR